MQRQDRVRQSYSLLAWGTAALAGALLLLNPRAAPGTAQALPPPASAQPAPVTAEAIDSLADIMVEAPEPRYVSPTMRDQIGRIWAPVRINGRGPFRLVLDTGASSSGVTAMVALALGLSTTDSPPVLLRGVTGEATVPTIRVDTLSVGDLAVDSPLLPIVPDALGGAQGVLGSEGLKNKRIFIDFHHDKIVITYSRGERAPRDFATVPFHLVRGELIVIDALVGSVRTHAVLDTGGQSTIGNLALRKALNASGGFFYYGKPDSIIGATLEEQRGEFIGVPPISMGSILLRDSGVTFADTYIFKHWKMLDEPALMIGMDVLGTVDTLIIDYRRKELQILPTRG
jgi:Aspartyl protease